MTYDHTSTNRHSVPTSPRISVLVHTSPNPQSPAELYLDLMKRTLTRTIMARQRERPTIRARLLPKRMAIFDDYQNLPDCRRAIDDYRAAHDITEPVRTIDTRAVFWQERL